MEEIVTDNEGLMETTVSTNSVSGQSTYDFPANLSVFRSMLYNGQQMRQLSFQEYSQFLDGYNPSTVTGVPQVYTVWNNQLIVFPTPATTVVNGFTLYYMRHPTEVVTPADTPEVPVQYHKAIIDYCLKEAYELDEDDNKYAMKDQDFQKKLTKLNDRNKWSSQEFYPRITVRQEDGW